MSKRPKKQQKGGEQKKRKKALKERCGKPLEESRVVAFLEANPEFFLRHRALTARLQIPHDSKGTISLVERQIGLLRTKLDAERQRMLQFIERARKYEALTQWFHELTLQVISAPDAERMERLLCKTLSSHFETEAVVLKLFAPEAAPDGDPLTTEFLAFSDRKQALCGALSKEYAQALFGDQEEPSRSAVLIPIQGGHRVGILAIGSTEGHRFTQEMSTEYLDRLGEIVSRRLQAFDHKA